MQKLFRYQENQEFFAQIAGNLENEGVAELSELGATNVNAIYRGIWFHASHEVLYRIVYQTRLCTRIFAPLIRFDCHSDRYLYKTASSIDWTRLLSVDDTFAISATVSHSYIQHSKFAALRLKDAVVDFFRDRTGRRPSIDRHNPDVQLHLHIENNKATIHLDVGSGSLHRRGYRTDSVEAPMQETVAAAVIRYSGWDGESSLHDPMCGSGTLLAEALMHVCRIPAGYLRTSFGFLRLPDYDDSLWDRVRSESNSRIRPIPDGITMVGSDVEHDAIRAAKANLKRLPNGENVTFYSRDIFSLPGIQNHTIITNPPYGLRIGDRTRIEDFYKEIGDFLKQKCTGSTCYLYAGKRELLKSVGLKTSWKKELVSGALDGRLAKYEMY